MIVTTAHNVCTIFRKFSLAFTFWSSVWNIQKLLILQVRIYAHRILPKSVLYTLDGFNWRRMRGYKAFGGLVGIAGEMRGGHWMIIIVTEQYWLKKKNSSFPIQLLYLSSWTSGWFSRKGSRNENLESFMVSLYQIALSPHVYFARVSREAGGKWRADWSILTDTYANYIVYDNDFALFVQ